MTGDDGLAWELERMLNAEAEKTYPFRYKLSIDLRSTRRYNARETCHKRRMHPQRLFDDGRQIRQCCSVAEGHVLLRSESGPNLADESAHDARVGTQVEDAARQEGRSSLATCDDESGNFHTVSALHQEKMREQGKTDMNAFEWISALLIIRSPSRYWPLVSLNPFCRMADIKSGRVMFVSRRRSTF